MLDLPFQSAANPRWYAVSKRSLDLAASLVLLVAALPPLSLAALAIKLTSQGPVFYLAKRCGLRGRSFTCLKLRTMYAGQEAILAARGLSNFGNNGRLLVFDHDPRITPLGRLLRKLSIDEIPQLINVLAGDMSLIGPRPLPHSMLADFPEIAALRSVVRPGMSGLWQVRRREKNVSVLDMVDDDLEYIRTRSLGLDLKIALLTIPKLIEPQRRIAHESGQPT